MRYRQTKQRPPKIFFAPNKSARGASLPNPFCSVTTAVFSPTSGGDRLADWPLAALLRPVNNQAPNPVSPRARAHLGVIRKLPSALGPRPVFGGLGDTELNDALGGNLNLFAGGWIAADAGFAVHQHEFSEAGQGKGVLGVLVSQVGELFENSHGGLLADFVLVGNRRGDLGFGECFCHIQFFGLLIAVN